MSRSRIRVMRVFFCSSIFLTLEVVHLGNNKNPLAFGWKERYKVAVGVAEALEYLHGRDDQPVIHRDVKSSNILLCDDFEPQVMLFYSLLLISLLHWDKDCYFDVASSLICLFLFQLSDFGLAKWATTTSSHITCTDVAGTFGYVTSLAI